ncbi:PAS domain protein [Leptospira interrogans serovar Copenhageni str. LT2050]|uniref:PAS domain protein n=1 Tax=Leptospira interrogans serovar Copenhageni str. LT2050 TaxID=1001598 RepID=M3IIM2_LEPIT|nr:PAS domain protein [Leptospira interrogans serovar Copenhageni str. LT2050]
MQENLLEKTGELQAILDGITEPLVLIDPGFRIRRVNRSTLEFSSQSSFLSIIGKNVSKFYTIVMTSVLTAR